MIVVSNTSPIINLAQINGLDLLPRLYGKIIVPSAVYREIVIAGAGRAGSDEVQTANWIEVRQVADSTLLRELRMLVDQGEAEAISLSVEIGADLLLIDETRGRQQAVNASLQHIGLLGVLRDAKSQGLLPNIKPKLDALYSKAGFWMSKELYDSVLRAAGE